MKNSLGPILAFCLLLGGCASAIPRNYEFSASNADGLIALGISSLSGGYSISLQQIDRATCRLIRPFWGGKKFDYSLVGNPQDRRFLIESLEPGYYVVRSAEFGGGYGAQVTNFNPGTIAFEVAPGEFRYVGDIRVSRSGAAVTGHDISALRQRLADYDNVSVAPGYHAPVQTPFVTGEEGLGSCPLSDSR